MFDIRLDFIEMHFSFANDCNGGIYPSGQMTSKWSRANVDATSVRRHDGVMSRLGMKYPAYGSCLNFAESITYT